MRSKLDLIMRGGGVKRYHTMRTLHSQSVAEHSFGVAWLVWLLSAEKPTAALLMAALAHDIPEHVTGDLPAPAKRNMNLGAKFKLMEALIMDTAGIRLDFLSDEEKKVLKVADTADLMLYCVQEIEMGNRSMHEIYHKGMSYIDELHPLSAEAVKLISTIGEMYHERCK